MRTFFWISLAVVSISFVHDWPGADAAEPDAGTVIVHPGDGARMVYVPGGPFVMGLNEDEAERVAKHLGKKDAAELWAWDCYPRRTVELPGYFIDECEVTVARWKKFVEATGHQSKSRETSQHFDHPESQSLPVGEIRWDEAKTYARWAGKSLPSDAQWEKAARGTDGRLYPWGNDPPTPDHGHFGPPGQQPTLYVPVGSYPQGASPYGALDMLGNQYEWTSEFLEPYPGNPLADKMRDYTGGKNVSLRGGSWYHGWISFYAAKRFGFEPDQTYYHVGFRTVWSPPAGYFESDQYGRDREAAAGTSPVPPTPIYRTSSPVSIDGQLDEACWKAAVPVAAWYVHGVPGQRERQSPLTARFAWDQDYLYIGYEVRDTQLVTVATGRENGPPDNRRPASEEYAPEKNLDLAEFFLSMGDERAFWEVHHTANNHLNNHWCEVPPAEVLAKKAKVNINDLTIVRDRFIPDDGAKKVARAVRMLPRADGQPSTVNDDSDQDRGYTGEIRIPWTGLGPLGQTPSDVDESELLGKQLPLLVSLLNGNGGQANYYHSAPYLPNKMLHFSAALWPRYVLVEPGK